MSQDALRHGRVVDHCDQPEAPATSGSGLASLARHFERAVSEVNSSHLPALLRKPDGRHATAAADVERAPRPFSGLPDFGEQILWLFAVPRQVGRCLGAFVETAVRQRDDTRQVGRKRDRDQIRDQNAELGSTH